MPGNHILVAWFVIKHLRRAVICLLVDMAIEFFDFVEYRFGQFGVLPVDQVGRVPQQWDARAFLYANHVVSVAPFADVGVPAIGRKHCAPVVEGFPVICIARHAVEQ